MKDAKHIEIWFTQEHKPWQQKFQSACQFAWNFCWKLVMCDKFVISTACLHVLHVFLHVPVQVKWACHWHESQACTSKRSKFNRWTSLPFTACQSMDSEDILTVPCVSVLWTAIKLTSQYHNGLIHIAFNAQHSFWKLMRIILRFIDQMKSLSGW